MSSLSNNGLLTQCNYDIDLTDIQFQLGQSQLWVSLSIHLVLNTYHTTIIKYTIVDIG